MFKRYGVGRVEDLELIAEAEHLHHSTAAHAEQFEQLCHRVGVADFDGVLSDDDSLFE